MDTVLAQVSEAQRLGDVLGEPVQSVRVGSYQAAGWGSEQVRVGLRQLREL